MKIESRFIFDEKKSFGTLIPLKISRKLNEQHLNVRLDSEKRLQFSSDLTDCATFNAFGDIES